MSHRKENYDRKFENWDQLLDPNLSDEKSRTEIINEIFTPVEIPSTFKEYIEPGTFKEYIEETWPKIVAEQNEQRTLIVDHLSLLKSPGDDAPYFDANYLLEKLLKHEIGTVQNKDSTPES